MFFSGLASYQHPFSTYQSTSKYPYGNERLKTSSPLLILLNVIFIEIDPPGKEFAMLLPRPHGVGVVVARGHHLRVYYEAQIAVPAVRSPLG